MKLEQHNDIVIIGAPIRNREWILPEYLDAIYNLNYDKSKIILRFLLNDCTDQSEAILNNFINSIKDEYKDCIIGKETFDFPPDERLCRRSRGIYKNLAYIRNMWKRCKGLRLLPIDYDYVFSIDSDILVHSEILNLLLSTIKNNSKVGMASAVVSNDIAGHGFWHVGINNILLENLYESNKCKLCINSAEDQNGKIICTKCKRIDQNVICSSFNRDFSREARLMRYPKFAINSEIKIPLTGAVCVYTKEIAENCFYRNSLHGEDYPFCLDIISLGYNIYCNTHINCRHLMSKSWLENVKKNPKKYYMLGYINFNALYGESKNYKFDYCDK